MALFPCSNYSGLKSNSDWSTAVSNAKNYIIAVATYTTYNVPIFVPKALLTSTKQYFFGGGYSNASFCIMYQLYASTSTAAGSLLFVNGVQQTASFTYYYD